MTTHTGWMGTSQACDRLGIRLRTLYRLIDEGQIAAYKMGRVIRMRVAAVDEFLERSRMAPGSLRHLYPPAKPARDGAGEAC